MLLLPPVPNDLKCRTCLNITFIFLDVGLPWLLLTRWGYIGFLLFKVLRTTLYGIGNVKAFSGLYLCGILKPCLLDIVYIVYYCTIYLWIFLGFYFQLFSCAINSFKSDLFADSSFNVPSQVKWVKTSPFGFYSRKILSTQIVKKVLINTNYHWSIKKQVIGDICNNEKEWEFYKSWLCAFLCYSR